MQTLPSTQVLLVHAEGWDSPRGEIALFERESRQDPWKCKIDFLPCLLGKSGLGWGRGLHTIPQKGKTKREGDMRSPAGIFPIRAAFGEMPRESFEQIQLDYLQTHQDLEYVDDPRSNYYNQCVDVRHIPQRDWNSSEKLLRNDDLYKLGLIIAHNENPIVPGMGSCIFMHAWRNQDGGSGGCTVLDYEVLYKIALHLSPHRFPLLVQGTSDALNELKKEFILP